MNARIVAFGNKLHKFFCRGNIKSHFGEINFSNLVLQMGKTAVRGGRCV